MDDSLAYTCVTELSALLRRREVSSVELTQLFLQRIDQYDERLNAYMAVLSERAIAAARAADTAMAAGHCLGALHGVPLALKDLLDLAGTPTTAGSILYADRLAGGDATVVRRLAGAGAVFLGKTHMVEFAFGALGTNPHYGTPWNPWDPDDHRVPGGSSSGSAVAVAAGLAPVALGSDTGGSVRIPASFCGLVGLKPTYGRVSRHGVLPLDPNLDSVGPLARTVEDASLVFETIAGSDPADPGTWDRPPLVGLEYLDDEVAGLRACFPREYFWEGVDPEVEAAVRGSAQVFAELGAHVDDVTMEVLSDLAELRPRLTLTAVETYRCFRKYLETRPREFDPTVLRRMQAGREVSAADFLDQQRALADLRTRTLHALESVDFLITPTTPFAAPLVEDVEDEKAYFRINGLCLRNTAAANLLGLCAVSLPCGFTREGLPIGLQLIGRPFDEPRLLRLAYAYEQNAHLPVRRPEVEAFG
ncbi:MAG: amidase [Candidatus Latescibacterota bacterium]